MGRIGMVNMLTGKKPATGMAFHNTGHTLFLSSYIKRQFNKDVDLLSYEDNIHNYDAIVINNGVNFKEGSWNQPGGIQSEAKIMLHMLLDYEGPLYSYNKKVDIRDFINKRKELMDFRGDSKPVPEVQCLQTDRFSEIVYGDSHALSIFKPGYGLVRNDGLTLNRFLKDTAPDAFGAYKTALFYVGNIDIRFHVHRHGGLIAVSQLCKRYHTFLKELAELGVDVTAQALLPIEDESRKLPGSGLYKGEKFFGSREERQEYVDAFNDTMYGYSLVGGYKFRDWELPLDGFEADNKFYCMEQKQSVHLRPSYYYNIDEIC